MHALAVETADANPCVTEFQYCQHVSCTINSLKVCNLFRNTRIAREGDDEDEVVVSDPGFSPN